MNKSVKLLRNPIQNTSARKTEATPKSTTPSTAATNPAPAKKRFHIGLGLAFEPLRSYEISSQFVKQSNLSVQQGPNLGPQLNLKYLLTDNIVIALTGTLRPVSYDLLLQDQPPLKL